MQLQNRFLKDYRRMFRLLRTGVTFTAFDTETTGLNSETCRIMELGAVQFNSSGITKTFSTLVNPECAIPFECVKITGITDQMVKNEKPIKDILPDFLDFLSDSIIIGHNVQFDMRFLQAELQRSKKEPVKNDLIDTLHFARWAYPDLKKFNQPFLAQYLSIPLQNAHRAFDDAKVCGNIFLRCIKDTAEKQKW